MQLYQVAACNLMKKDASMTPHKGSSLKRRSNRMQDVYREMYLLESRRPGSEMGLALALLRAWNETESLPREAEARSWIRQISPLCVKMIEDSLAQGCACGTVVQYGHFTRRADKGNLSGTSTASDYTDSKVPPG